MDSNISQFDMENLLYLNVTFTDNELVEEEEGEDDRHGHGDEAQLVGVHRPLIINSSFSIIMRIGHLHRLLSQLLSIVNILPQLRPLVDNQADKK